MMVIRSQLVVAFLVPILIQEIRVNGSPDYLAASLLAALATLQLYPYPLARLHLLYKSNKDTLLALVPF